MLNSLATHSVSSPPASREVAPPTYRDAVVAVMSHAFTTPVVREVRRPTAEPLSFAATW